MLTANEAVLFSSENAIPIKPTIAKMIDTDATFFVPVDNTSIREQPDVDQ